MNKQLFSNSHRNEAGGPAFEFSPEHALAQYAVTGTFHGTFYATDTEQLEKVKELAGACTPELVAKTAIYCRKIGRMKDVPAFLVAHLATRDVALMLRVFPHVIDDARMLRAFVAIVRSGVTGRKSFGTAPKRALRAWFAARSPETIFRQSIGQSPSMSDVIKMVRPPPRNDKGEADAVREALYGYLIGKNVDRSKLPPLANAYEAFKSEGGTLPDVPFEMLTALPLRNGHWIDLAKRMTFGQLRQNLNTLFRHGVFADPKMVELIAERLSDPESIRRSRTMPYQLLAAHRAVEDSLPKEIVRALGHAVELAVANVPPLPGFVALCPDVSGSMHSSVTGHRGSATSKVRCIDVAALATAAFLRKNEASKVIPFTDQVVPLPRPLNALDSIVSNANLLSSLPSGGTACAAPLRWLNERNEAPDVVVFMSDNQSWADLRQPLMNAEWDRLRQRNPRAKLVLIDLQPYGSTQVENRHDVLNIGGFSDAVFDVVSSFVKGSATGGNGFLEAVNAMTI